MINLYKLKQEFDAVQAMIVKAEGVITPEIAQAIDALKISRDEKLVGCAVLLKNLDAELEAFSGELSRLKAKLAAIESHRGKVVEIVEKILPHDEKFQSGVHTMFYTKSEAVKVVDQDKLPAEYLRRKLVIEPDKVKIKNVLSNAENAIAGAELETRFNLQVK